MVIVLLGMPGSGKGTQAKLLSQRLKIPMLIIGDVLRDEVKKQTQMGEIIKKYMSDGKLVPDEIIIKITKKFLNSKNDLILDGVPRNLTQAKALHDTLLDKGLKVIHMDCEEKEVIKRLTARRLCGECGKDYNLISAPPKVKDKCDVCGGKLIQRKDDNEEVISNRLKVYAKETEPLISFYEKAGVLKKVDCNLDREEVHRKIKDALFKHNN